MISKYKYKKHKSKKKSKNFLDSPIMWAVAAGLLVLVYIKKGKVV